VIQLKRIDILIGTISLASTIFFFIPFSLYLLNREAFFTAPHVVAGMLLAFTVAIFLILASPLLLTKGKLRVVAVSLLAFLCIGIWVQANILSWDYGLLDGSTLRWRLFEKRSIIDVLVWLTLFVSITIIGIRKKVSLRYVFFILLFMQSGNILFTWMNSGKDITKNDGQNLSITDNDRFIFSKDKNIILMVLDAYETDIFNEYLEKNPELKDALPGFTYYPNAVSEHFYTLRSIATLLTGNYLIESAFPDSKTQKERKDELFKHHSIPALLKQSGYHVGIYPFYARSNYPPKIFGGIADNYIHSNLVLHEGANEISTLMEVGLFRIAAHPFKKMIYDRFLLTPSFEQDRDEFSTNMEKQLKAGLDVHSFKYYHLQGMHGPHIINGERFDDQKRESALRIAAHVNKMLADFASKLQEVGIYDQTDIFIVADHGLYHDSKSVVFGKFAPDTTEHDTPPLDDFVKKCRGIPLFLYKPANATGPMGISKTPVCLTDVLPTITDIAAVEIKEKLDGVSIRTLQEDTARIRRHFTSEAHRTRSVIPDYEFYVSGFSWYDSSWTYTGDCHTLNAIERIPLDNYVLGQKLTFGLSGNGKEYLDKNWTALEATHQSNSATVTISLPVANPKPGMVITLELSPSQHQPKEVSLSISINGNKKQTFYIDAITLVQVEAPYNPEWQDITPQSTQEEVKPEDDLWAWSPTIPELSEARLNITLQLENIAGAFSGNTLPPTSTIPAIEIRSLCIKQ